MTLAVLRSYDAACLAITEGQFLDMQFEERLDVTEAEYLRMVGGKTAALLSACTRIGAQVAGADAALVEGMASFGRLVGLAFQMTDDILGIWGDAARTGKAAANDIRRRKKSLPIAFALETARGAPPTACAPSSARARCRRTMSPGCWRSSMTWARALTRSAWRTSICGRRWQSWPLSPTPRRERSSRR